MREDKSLIEYPSKFPIKVMGRTQDGFAQAIAAVVRIHAPDFDAATLEMRASAQGNYLSVTATINAVGAVTTAAYGLPSDDATAERLEAYLRAHVDPAVEVVYVCGGDNARFSLAFAGKGRCVVVARPKAEPEVSAWRADPRTAGFTTGTPFRPIAPNAATQNVAFDPRQTARSEGARVMTGGFSRTVMVITA